MSSIFESFLSTSEVLQAFSSRNFVDAMLRFEAALARAQASVGLIPEAAAQSIIGTCKVELFDVPKIERESGRAGSIAIPLIRSLKETVGLFNQEAAGFVHFGCSSQDVIDTALALVTRNALDLIDADLDKAITALRTLATRHAADPVLARTLMQPASVTSFGLKCVNWAAPLVRSRQRLQISAGQALSVQLGGVVGTLAPMKGQGPQVIALMASDLQLNAPSFSWHTQRDEWVGLGCELGLMVGSLGKMAKDMTLMSQYEVGELGEPFEPGRGDLTEASLTPNALACMLALAAAQRVPQRVAALLAAMPQEHERALGNWQAELAEWPALLLSAHGAVRAMAQALAGLQVNAPRMLANLNTLRAQLAPGTAQLFSAAHVQSATELTQTQLQALQALSD